MLGCVWLVMWQRSLIVGRNVTLGFHRALIYYFALSCFRGQSWAEIVFSGQASQAFGRWCVACQIPGKPNQGLLLPPLQPVPVHGEPFQRAFPVDCVGAVSRIRIRNQYLQIMMFASVRYPECVPWEEYISWKWQKEKKNEKTTLIPDCRKLQNILKCRREKGITVKKCKA